MNIATAAAVAALVGAALVAGPSAPRETPHAQLADSDHGPRPTARTVRGSITRSAGAAHAAGPPPGHTGGFGEPTCQSCHSEYPLDVEGTLSVEGLPERYAPGDTYAVTVVLRSTGMARAGFQGAVRFAEGERSGRQAGTLQALDARLQVVTDSLSGVQYVQHRIGGTDVPDPEVVTWTFAWTAPAAHGPVAIHLAANSANGDDSPFGDLIYTAERRIDVRRGK